MVSEAASSGKKVVAFSPDAGGVDAGHKYARFCDMFARQGHILYTDPKGVAAAIDRFVRNKNITQPVRDRERVLNAMRSLVR
jgi:hypothetical protein